MITSTEALQIILDKKGAFGLEQVQLSEALGRVIAKDAFPDRPFPPFDRVCMDGIAINYNAYQSGQRIFEVAGVQAAGQPQLELQDTTMAIEVMTGAALPIGTTTVIRYEDLETVEKGFEINAEIRDQANIHFQGSDAGVRDVLIKMGSPIRSAEIGMLATIGMSEVAVRKLPRVAIFSTGDELVDVDATPKPHQIRRSNSHMMMAALKKMGVSASLFHVNDKMAEIREYLESILSDYDAILMSGGVSKGKFDFIPDVLKDLDVEICFHRVKQRPGKPFLFGVKAGCCIFGFPGNPVSTLAGVKKYFEPWLKASIGLPIEFPMVRLKNDVKFKPNLTYYAQAAIHHVEGVLYAEVLHGGGSGDMVNMGRVDGFIEIPSGREDFKAGELFPYMEI